MLSKSTLNHYAMHYPDAADDLFAWHDLIKKSDFTNFAELRNIVPSVSIVNSIYLVFNIRGGRYRLITTVWFEGKQLFVKRLLPHKEYDRWSDEQRKK